MASHTRPFLTSGAALASAAAVVLATPAIAPAIGGSALAASSAQYELSTFSDVFTIPASEWVNAYFQGYGGVVGPDNEFPLEPYATNCSGSCVLVGPSAVAYLALDALINGTGNGWEDVDQWSVSAVNYLFEADWSADPGGISAGVLYLLQTSIGSANPLISTAITLAFAGPALVTIVFDNALQLLGDAALGVPLVGAYLYGAINAFLGPASLNEDYQGYFPGVSGVLNWSLDLLTGTAPTPPVDEGVTPPAAALAAVEAPAPVAESADPVATAEAAAVAEVAEVAEVTAADTPTEVGAGTDSAAEPEVTAVPEVTAEPETVESAAEAPSAADVKADTAEASAADEATAPAPAKSTAKRPVRDALATVSASIGAALSGTTAGAPTSESTTPSGDASSAESTDSVG